MALEVTNATLTDPPTPSEIEQNFSDVEDKFNQNITNDDISATAAIATSKLAARQSEFTITLRGLIGELTFSTTTPSLYVPLPGTSADGTYQVTSAAWFCSDVGDQTTDFTVTWGRFSGGSWSGTTLWTVTNMPGHGAADDTPGHATATINSMITLDASDATMIAVHFPNAKGTGFMSTAATDQFVLTFKIKRVNGLI